MAEGPRRNADRAQDAARLRDLEERLSKKVKRDAKPQTMASHDQAHIAWRMVIELVAGLGIGFGVGLGLDTLFGTRPLLLVVFTFLGFAAGVKVMIRTAAELNGPVKTGAEKPAARAHDDDDDERD